MLVPLDLALPRSHPFWPALMSDHFVFCLPSPYVGCGPISQDLFLRLAPLEGVYGFRFLHCHLDGGPSQNEPFLA